MREYVQSLRAIFSCWTTGERLSYEGEHYQLTLMTPNFTPPPLDSAPPQIKISAVGPYMLGVAGRGFSILPTRSRLHCFPTGGDMIFVDMRPAQKLGNICGGVGFLGTAASTPPLHRSWPA